MIDNWHVWQTREYARNRATVYREVIDWAQSDEERGVMQIKLDTFCKLWEDCWGAMIDDDRGEAESRD